LKTIDEDRRARHDYINRSGQIHLSRREICPNNRDHRCKTIYRLTVKGDVPVDGFWSISVYGADGYFVKNEQSAYSVNNVTAKKEVDGSIGIQFGGCDGKMPNCIPTTSGWNYWVRLYRPCAEILNGQWKFPDPERVQ
jgi:hypothetical protein